MRTKTQPFTLPEHMGTPQLFGGVRVALLFSVLCCFVCVLYPMLTVSLDCPSLISPSVFSNLMFTAKALWQNIWCTYF